MRKLWTTNVQVMMDYIFVYLDPGNQGSTFVASKFALVSFLFVLHCVSNKQFRVYR